mmetsp:Transcript_76894/g.135465  ORF Transcript_76894/g.135465 Transcript_76894/m.135465 type:complete len:519 (-) Transcript_76894:57-1613(-)
MSAKSKNHVAIPTAVFLTKQDLEGLQGNSYARDIASSSVLPLSAPVRSLPAQVPSGPAASQANRGSSGARGSITAGGTPTGTHSQWPPPPRRRTRSASEKRHSEGTVQSPMHPHSAEIIFNAPDAPQSMTSAAAAALAAKQAGKDIKKPMRVVRAKTVARMDRITPEPQFPLPPQAAALGRASAGSGGHVLLQNLPLPASLGGLALELQGHDPRRLPRLDSRAEALAGPVAQAVAEAAPAALDLNLQVSGQSAASAPVGLEYDAPPPWEEGEWTSSEQDGEDDPDASLNDSEAEHFHYRRYRYKELEKVRKAPPEQVKRSRPRRPAPRAGGHMPSDEERDMSPWLERISANVPALHQPSRPRSRIMADDSDSGGSTPRCEDERPDEDLLRRVGDVLVQFYGLKGDREECVRTKHSIGIVNLVFITEAAWANRKRESQFEEPPMMWIRGGRVYDFHGDRGTIAEFEHDLLTRQVEDDAVCRLRRREQGLMPFPFVAIPLKEKNAEDEPDEAEGPRRRPR